MQSAVARAAISQSYFKLQATSNFVLRRQQRSSVFSTNSSMATAAVTSPGAAVPDLSTIKGVLFDIDGTLTNSDPLHLLAFQEILVEVGFNGGVPIDEAFFRQHISGRHNPEIAQDLFPQWPEERRVAFYMDKEQRFRDMAASKLQRMPGLTEFLQWVDSRQLRKAAVTNAPRDNTLMMLRALQLDTTFEAVVLGEECPRAKPHPDPYLRGLELLGLQPHEAIVIEDSPAGVRAARAAGVPVFGITSGQEPAVLWEAGCCMLLQDFTQLVALAEQHCSSTGAQDGMQNGNGNGNGVGVQQQQQQQLDAQHLEGSKAAAAPVGYRLSLTAGSSELRA